jgi:hypothetical protein
VSAAPVTAHEIIFFRCMPSPNAATKDIEQAVDLSPVQLVYLNWLRVKRSTFDNSGRDSSEKRKCQRRANVTPYRLGG